MFRKITAPAAALATVATLALVAVPANAARSMDYSGADTVYTFEPTGTHTMETGNNYETGDEYEGCQTKANAANGYLDVARGWEARGYPALAQYMEQRADEIAAEANKEGCNLHQPE
jgi:ABC-type sugar transport system substrate-binding protein